MSIYQITEEYLIGTFDPNDIGSSFTAMHTEELNRKLLAFDPDYRSKTEKKEEIRRAFCDFYINTAKVALFFKGTEQIIVKLMPYKSDPDETVHIKKISDYLVSIAEQLGEADKEKNILLIPKEHVEKMGHFLKEVPIPVDTHEILRKAISQALCLDSKDSVFFMNGKVVIRFFKRTGVERRFEGLPAEEIKKLVDDLYSGESENDMPGDLDMIISTIADSQLNFAVIDNQFFNHEHVKIIQDGLVRFYKTKISHNETVIKAVANYIFRESFYYIHEQLAEKLLELIERKDKNAEVFLRFYNGSTYIQNGNKYVTPEIIDEGGQTWNIAAVVNFMSQFSKNKTLISKKEKSIQENLAKLFAESSALADMIPPNKPPTQDIHEHILRQLGKNRAILNKDRNGGADSLPTNLDINESHEEFQKNIRDMHKRIDFLHMRIEGDQKAINEIQDKFAEQQKKYDMLVIAISEVLMDRHTPATIKDI